MNRKARRAAFKSWKQNLEKANVQSSSPADLASLVAQAGQAYEHGLFERARDLCRQALMFDPTDAAANNLLGVVFQALGKDRLAIAPFTKAIAADESRALFHYNIAFSHQRLGEWDAAKAHFGRAIALRMDDQPIERHVMQYPPVANALNRIAGQWPRRLTFDELFGGDEFTQVAGDAFLCCALEQAEISSPELERLLTTLRFALLERTTAAAPAFDCTDEHTLGFYSALAQQCFIHEFVFALTDREMRQVEELRSLLELRLAANDDIPPLLVVAVASYFPLHSLDRARAMAERPLPGVLGGLVRQQILDPIEEAKLGRTIPILAAADDQTSLAVAQQYEDNPYPRWTMVPDATAIGDWRTRFDAGEAGPRDILVAGCGTGQNAIQAALKFPRARVLAIDLSRASLAYAMRKTREAGIENIDYAQADILKLGAMGREFDRIEAVGVLHHIADPEAAWRVLLRLLRPGGIMDLGLYSEIARRPLAAAREAIAARGYKATPHDIRRFRQDVIATQHQFVRALLASRDFYSTSGCRDLLFHVMEQRFTLPRIAQFLAGHGLLFLGFRLATGVFDCFCGQFPDPQALVDLTLWHTFEQSNPQTFAGMYRFAVRKPAFDVRD